MKNKGFTLIELLVVVTIISVLVIALGFSFEGWVGGYKVESQTKDLYADLMAARINAMQRNKSHFVVVTSDSTRGQYSIFEDADGNSAYDAGTDTAMLKFTNPKILDYPLLCAAAANCTTANGTVRFNAKGLYNTDIGKTICLSNVNVPDVKADYDCISISRTRINIGSLTTKIADGGACADANCIAK